MFLGILCILLYILHYSIIIVHFIHSNTSTILKLYLFMYIILCEFRSKYYLCIHFSYYITWIPLSAEIFEQENNIIVCAYFIFHNNIF